MSSLALHRAKTIHGWMTGAELEFLAMTAKKSQVIFEIGSYMGRSTRAMGDNTCGTIYAIDPWKAQNYNAYETAVAFDTDEIVFNMFYCNMHDLIAMYKVVPITKRWEDYEPWQKADFIFIDGDHRYEMVKRDICKALQYLRGPGVLDKPSVIAGHDYAPVWPGVVRAVNEAFPNKKINVIDTIWSVEL